MEEICNAVPKDFIWKEEMAAVFVGWDAVYAFTAKNGDEQCCPVVKWRGIVKDDGFSEYLLVSSYRFFVKVANNQHIWFSLGKLQLIMRSNRACGQGKNKTQNQ